jgi:hypothetical protein
MVQNSFCGGLGFLTIENFASQIFPKMQEFEMPFKKLNIVLKHVHGIDRVCLACPLPTTPRQNCDSQINKLPPPQKKTTQKKPTV